MSRVLRYWKKQLTSGRKSGRKRSNNRCISLDFRFLFWVLLVSWLRLFPPFWCAFHCWNFMPNQTQYTPSPHPHPYSSNLSAMRISFCQSLTGFSMSLIGWLWCDHVSIESILCVACSTRERIFSQWLSCCLLPSLVKVGTRQARRCVLQALSTLTSSELVSAWMACKIF